MEKPISLESLVERLKAEGQPVKRARRRWKRKPKKHEGEYTPRRAETQKAFWATPSGQWKHLEKTYRARAKKRGEESKWKLSLEDWNKLWIAGNHQLQDGSWNNYMSLRGKWSGSAKLCRIDEKLDWTLNNIVLMYQGMAVINGRKLCQQPQE